MHKILWVHDEVFSGAQRAIANAIMRRCGINPAEVKFIPSPGRLIKGKGKKEVSDPAFAKEFQSAIAKNISHSTVLIICNGKVPLHYITKKYSSLALCRGGVYKWEDFLPVLVLDNMLKTKWTDTGEWIIERDLAKAARIVNGKQRHEPVFEQAKIGDASLLVDAQNAIMIGIDIETTGQTIACIGYACLMPDFTIRNHVIPFIDGTKKDNAYWDTAAIEADVWKTIRKVHQTPAIKTMQNGIYDNAYFLKYNIPLYNYLADSMHLFRSIWVELPKRLDFVSSICLDTYTYWKGEKAESTLDNDDDKTSSSIPTTTAGMQQYWQYCAMDCHNTVLSTAWLVKILSHPQMKWALDNYAGEFPLQTGPCIEMCMQGIACDREIQELLDDRWRNEAAAAHADLLKMVGDENFNPASPKQVQDLIFNVLRATPVGRGKDKYSTQEKYLKILQTQSPLLDIIIEQIWAAKKPQNNASKYGRALRMGRNNRFMFQISPVTETGRMASKGHQFWIGTNAQNTPREARVMLCADPGYVLFEIDYDRSDAYFTAFGLNDSKYVETMLRPIDQHCYHAAHFFKMDYEKLYEGYKEDADWVVHPIKGLRQITKRIVYGASYLMAAFTLFIQMGRKSVVAAALALGHKDAENYSYQQLIQICQILLDSFFELYPGIKQGLNDELIGAKTNGKKVSCAFGRTRLFLSDLSDPSTQRELAAFIGQGGTAGNINTSMLRMHYSDEGKAWRKQGGRLLSQVHDSIIGQVPENKLQLINDAMQLMLNPCTLHSRTFTVPVGAKVGRAWGKRMLNWKESVTLEQIDEHDNKWRSKFFSTKQD